MGLYSKSPMELAVNHHQRKVLHAIFAHPVNANLDLKDVTNVLTGLGAEIDAKAKSWIGVTLKRAVDHFAPDEPQPSQGRGNADPQVSGVLRYRGRAFPV